MKLDEAALSACLAVPRWVRAVLDGQPYDSPAALLAVAEREAATLTAEEVELALADHPRIGDKTGSAASRAEQSGVDNADEFVAANREYEQRFGRIYLVCAAGRGGAELLADLRSRLANDPDTELAVTVRELGKIALLRLAKVVS
ncbi:2-oxo-4-hydroxy-4-carboxy-5-ureidoimidazoline decarboxylase [Kutzneria kofuensis]|uniref:2-oxo-4-hydroxy-4-carboxy-5-ureidoimidazoline decarboxylase n=1 Tax=Kutzneria kofuensis TaxID=103725 RepID=A0A7W9KRW0_9PSEU|nr:2-oxo-4-hydroxy-4-carboxy-5-ureidoimidazoline decarboxylase [Kutzneria kofuensis]MBB5897585.1 2-oxo-4-hydroxy-4-carboxy-5-ureidoimidazoline decarboxylase [Kutzneria kofuensis]